MGIKKKGSKKLVYTHWKQLLKRIRERLRGALFSVSMTQRKRVFFESLSGLRYYGNISAVYEYLMSSNGDQYDCIWYTKLLLRMIPEQHTIRKRSKANIYRQTSSVVLEDSLSTLNYAKWNQLCINTWHGGGLYKVVRHNRVIDYDVFLSSSSAFSEMLRRQWRFTGTIIPSGLPRNDALFTSNYKEIRKKVTGLLGLPMTTHIVLYAPTWRDAKKQEIEYPNIESIKKVYQDRFRTNCVFLVRGHYYMQLEDHKKTINVNSYPDVQELLIAADMLISDYSSIIWDYSFLYRPCFLFTPDLDWYIENRGLETDIHTWGFPVCMNDQELCDAILTYDADKHRKAMEKHHDDLGSYETGHACEQVTALIHEFCSLKNRDRVRMKKALRTGQYDLTRIGHNFIP